MEVEEVEVEVDQQVETLLQVEQAGYLVEVEVEVEHRRILCEILEQVEQVDEERFVYIVGSIFLTQ